MHHVSCEHLWIYIQYLKDKHIYTYCIKGPFYLDQAFELMSSWRVQLIIIWFNSKSKHLYESVYSLHEKQKQWHSCVSDRGWFKRRFLSPYPGLLTPRSLLQRPITFTFLLKSGRQSWVKMICHGTDIIVVSERGGPWSIRQTDTSPETGAALHTGKHPCYHSLPAHCWGV